MQVRIYISIQIILIDMESHTFLLFMCVWGILPDSWDFDDDNIHRFIIYVINNIIAICIDRFNLYENWIFNIYIPFMYVYMIVYRQHALSFQ